MAVIASSFVELKTDADRSGEDSLQGNDLVIKATHRRKFALVTSLPTDDSNLVLAYAKLPTLYAAFPSNPALLCNRRSAKLAEGNDGRQWFVTCEYASNIPQPKQNPPNNNNPLLRATRYNLVGWNTYTRVCYQARVAPEDATGPGSVPTGFISAAGGAPFLEDPSGILNSAGDPMSPTLEEEIKHPLLQVIRNEANWNPNLAAEYENAVNLDDFVLNGVAIAAYTAKMTGITQLEQWENGQRYHQCTYEMELDVDDYWTDQILDRGFAFLTTGPYNPNPDLSNLPVRTRAVDLFGAPLAEPPLLDGEGHLLPQKDIDAGHVHFDYFFKYKTRPFGALRL